METSLLILSRNLRLNECWLGIIKNMYKKVVGGEP